MFRCTLRSPASWPLSHSVLFAGLLSITGLLQGCLNGRSEPVHYQLLTASAEQNSAAPLAGKTIGIGPVQVAQFLQRPQVVTHGGGPQLQFDDNLRWGEPLEQGVQRVMVQNIAALTGAQTRNFPWRQVAIPDYALRIDIIDLDRLPGGESILEVNWILEDSKTTRIIATRQQRIGTRGDYDDLFAQLARDAAQALISQR